jgi:hypothetical protein
MNGDIPFIHPIRDGVALQSMIMVSFCHSRFLACICSFAFVMLDLACVERLSMLWWWLLVSKKSLMSFMGMVVGKLNGLVGLPEPLRMPTQYHLGLLCGMPWSLVLRVVW